MLAVLVAASLSAGTVSANGATPAIDFPDFSSIAGLTLNGNAAQSGNVLRVTPAASSKRGSAWAQTQVSTATSFESHFRASVHNGSIYPADGLTFTLQSEGLSALGDAGSAHGYGGTTPVTPSVAVDVSLFPQIFNGSTEQVSVLLNGDTSKPVVKASSSVLLYGNPFSVWVDYDANTLALQVFVAQADTKPATPILSTTVDLSAVVGASAYAGFTAATGALYAAFDILSWQVDALADETPPTVNCSADPSVLWPPTNKLEPVAVTVNVTDDGSGPAGFTLTSVTSNEGDITAQSRGWALGTDDTNGFVRAARFGTGDGRVYTLTYEGLDAAGNSAVCEATVSVPHDLGLG